MKNFQGKNKWENIMHSKPVLVLFGVFLIFFIWNIIHFVLKTQETIKNRKFAQDKIVELKKEKDRLTSDIQKLQTSEGKESAIREKFGWIKQGENLVIVVDDQNPGTEKNLKNKGFLSFIKNWFK
ncbi:septum formation initiator family protein [Candidatus Nomurabacteria bacterium]|nr:septum formation initiator family protein [Candidatus Nomurabacteria bacterium]